MNRKFWGLMLGAFLGFILISLVFAADELAIKQQQYNVKLDQLTKVQAQLDAETARYEAVLSQYTAAKKEAQDKENACKKAKDAYDRGAQNVDLLSTEQLAKLTQDYKDAKKELSQAEEKLKKSENEKTYLENNLVSLKAQKTQKEKELLGIKADIFDLKLREPVWVEGYGESLMDENTTMKQCAESALAYARRDATEKGGKAVIEAVTKVEMFQLVKDEIKLTVKVQVLEQDTSGEYGKAKRVIIGELIKYTASVRVKVQSIDTANPYREQLAELEKGKPEGTILPVTEVGKKVQSVSAAFVLVKGRSFTMGDTFNEKSGEGDSDEKPLHQVTLTYNFYIGKYELTFEEYDAYCNATGITKPGDEGWGRGKRPVINVSWWDAIKYCNWLSQSEGLPKAYNENGDLLDSRGNVTTDITRVKGYRLPTEAEWEYAARERGPKVRFGNGQDLAKASEINFNASYGKYSYLKPGEYRGKTLPVGSFAPNSLGLYDLSGNVWEWCTDWYQNFSVKSQTNPYIYGTGSGRVLRGGSWFDDAYYVRVACRFSYASGSLCSNVGFRLLRTP